MANELKSLSAIYNQRLFRVPDYQRGYAWGQEQRADFWEDLKNLQDGKNHYTGLLSLKSIANSALPSCKGDEWLIKTGDRQVWHVVDGQQRLTTISILLFELIKLVRNLPENRGADDRDIIFDDKRLERIQETFISIKRPEGKDIAYLFGYETDNPSAEYMKRIIFEEEGGPECQESYYTSCVKSKAVRKEEVM